MVSEKLEEEKQISKKEKKFPLKSRFNRKIIFIILGIILIGGVTLAGFHIFGKKKPQKETSLLPALVPRKIDGVLVPKGRDNFFPVTVIIENLNIVRPQYGLGQANVVYEALAEGGITRFLAVFASGDEIKKIGPVRSARPYFLDWAAEYKGIFAHVGGSPQALAVINNYPFINLDQMFRDSIYYWRDLKEGVAIEHTVFTSSELLARAVRDKGKKEKEGDFKPWLFKKATPYNQRQVKVKNIEIDFSTHSYKVRYVYDPKKNVYLRFNGGEEHKDALNNKQISVSNVVVQFVKASLLDESRLKMETIGEGEALVFQEGKVISGKWVKKSIEDRTRFYDDQGKEIAFIPGKIWIEIVPPERTVSY